MRTTLKGAFPKDAPDALLARDLQHRVARTDVKNCHATRDEDHAISGAGAADAIRDQILRGDMASGERLT